MPETPDDLRLDFAHEGRIYCGASLAFLAAAGVPDAVIRARVIDHLCARVDASAEAARLRAVTPGAGQAMEYLEAQAQAVAALAAPADPEPGTYPMLEASIGIDRDPQTGLPATDVRGVARAVLAAAQAWRASGAAIRRARLEAKAAIAAAASPEAALAAHAALVWPAA